jgi:hypothetical protein
MKCGGSDVRDFHRCKYEHYSIEVIQIQMKDYHQCDRNGSGFFLFGAHARYSSIHSIV